MPGLLALALATVAMPSQPLELDVPYVESPPDIIKLMLDMADVTWGDYVIDLGTGDGRIVIAAVKRGATGHGVDLDPERVEEARRNAREAGVADRVAFIEQDLFESDLSRATVVTLFLNEEVNLRARPLLLEQLAPGTRVVSHNFGMGDWKPDGHDQFLRNANGNFFIHDVFLWIVPADISGNWRWDSGGKRYAMDVSQNFQELEVGLSVEGRPLKIDGAYLRGERFTILASSSDGDTKYTLSGQVEGDSLSGTLHGGSGNAGKIENWTAKR